MTDGKMNLLHLGLEVKGATCNCSISSFKRDMYPTCYLVTFFLGFTGNIMSLYYFVVLCRKKKRFTSVNLYMINLLVSDLMLVCSLPLRATYYLMDTWVFGDIACRVTSFVFYINMYSSIYFLMVLSVMRYLAVTQPYRYLQLQASRSAWVVCFLVWMFVSLASVPMLSEGTVQSDNDKVRCLELNAKNLSTIAILNYAAIAIGFALPVAVIAFCYIFMLCTLMKPREVQGTKSPNYRKSCALVVIILIIFLVCFLPYHMVRTIFLHAEEGTITSRCSDSCQYITRVRQAAVVTLCLAAGNSCLDPVLFYFMGCNFCNFGHKRIEKLLGRDDKGEVVNSPNADQLP